MKNLSIQEKNDLENMVFQSLSAQSQKNSFDIKEFFKTILFKIRSFFYSK